ncbi:hypothetical protein V6N12_028752 [Hibiscus sabdariffa]|uniref:Uncharacterized protein n=1 Tax=Hibiscus sabdariffa TaxID=183260 RepID=A0ABR2F6S3_9ROSI
MISNQFIHGKCWESDEEKLCYFIVVYASPTVSIRMFLWEQLLTVKFRNGEAWLLSGDFNALIRIEERFGGLISQLGVSSLFWDFVYNDGLFEVEYRGADFTWWWCLLYERLDRYLVSDAWYLSFPNTMVIHLDRVGSDHCPLILIMTQQTRSTDDRLFCFIVAWQDHPQYNEFLTLTWNPNESEH